MTTELMFFKNHSNISLEIDPTSGFDPSKKDEILQSLGLIPTFINNRNVPDYGFKTAFEKEYSFGIHEIEGGNVDENGTFSYPGDPKLQPLAVYRSSKESCYQYLYGIIAIVNNSTGDTFVTRMD